VSDNVEKSSETDIWIYIYIYIHIHTHIYINTHICSFWDECGRGMALVTHAYLAPRLKKG